jgi:hypothetical protein
MAKVVEVTGHFMGMLRVRVFVVAQGQMVVRQAVALVVEVFINS